MWIFDKVGSKVMTRMIFNLDSTELVKNKNCIFFLHGGSSGVPQTQKYPGARRIMVLEKINKEKI